MSGELKYDETREAIESLGGYAYQIYQSAIAWASLDHGHSLFLEIAEDYAICAQQAVEAVQVKRTKANITSNTSSICQSIDSVLQLFFANPDRKITLRYLTTSVIGKEKKLADQINNEATLHYWEKVRDTGDLEPLRNRLLHMSVSDASKGFIRSASSDELRENLVRRLHFDCGAPHMDHLRQTLRDILVAEGDRKNLFAKESERVASSIVERILLISSSKGRRELTRADFLRLFEEENTAQVPVSALRRITAAQLATLGDGQRTEIVSQHIGLEPLATVDPPSPLARREVLHELVKNTLDRGTVWLYGGSGFGKSLLAKATLEDVGGAAAIVRLRDKSAELTEALLAGTSVEVHLGSYSGLLIDDIDHIETQTVQGGLSRLLGVTNAKQTAMVFCSYRRPSPTILSQLGISDQACIEVGHLTQQDIADLVQDAPNNHETWQTYLRIGSSNGHPQLAHALAVGLQQRDWPIEDLQKMAAPLGQDEAINLTKEEARRRILAELPNDQRLLLYRLSLFTSTFTRKHASALSDVVPEIATPGEKLDKLVGPWIDQVGSQHFQISPLMAGSGLAQLSSDDQKAVHSKIATTLTDQGVIDASRIDQITLSGILGEADSVLVMLCLAVLATEVEQLEMLANQAVAFKFWRTDRPCYLSNRRVSIQLRMAQTLLLLADNETDKFLEAFHAFERELEELGDVDGSSILKMALYGKLLLVPNLAEAYPDFPALIAVAASAASEKGIQTEYKFPEIAGYPEAEMSMGSGLFTLQLSNLKSLETLKDVLVSLANLGDVARQEIEPEVDAIRFNPEQIVKSLLVKAKDDDGYDPQKFADSTLKFSKDFDALGESKFAIACLLTAAVIHAEEIKDFDEALRILDLAEDKFGSLFEIRRARAGVFFNQDNHQDHIDAIEPYLDGLLANSWIEQTYLFRELAISHGNLGNWSKAHQYFQKAQDASQKVEAKPIRLMTIGLAADAAICLWKAGEKVDALKGIKGALLQSSTVDAKESFKATALHRLVRFCGWWIYAEHNDLKNGDLDINADMVIGCASNPNPHSALADPPIGTIRMIFYLLAEVDIAHGSAAGIWSDIVSRYSDDEGILSQECLLYPHVFTNALKRRDGETLAVFGPSTVDALAAFPSIPKENLSPENPLSGKPSRLDGSEWENGRLGLLDQLTSFMFDAIIGDCPEQIDALVAKLDETDRPLLSSQEVQALSEGAIMVADPSISMMATVREFRTAIRTGDRPVAPNLFLVSLRIFETCLKAPENYEARLALIEWVFDSWQDAMRAERFRFSTPDLAEAEVYPILADQERNITSLSRLLLALRPYLGIGVADGFMDALRRAS